MRIVEIIVDRTAVVEVRSHRAAAREQPRQILKKIARCVAKRRIGESVAQTLRSLHTLSGARQRVLLRLRRAHLALWHGVADGEIGRCDVGACAQTAGRIERSVVRRQRAAARFLHDATAILQERRKPEKTARHGTQAVAALLRLLARRRAAALGANALNDVRQPTRRLEWVRLFLEKLVIGRRVLSLLRGLLQRASVHLRVRAGQTFGLRGGAEIADLLRRRKLSRRRVLLSAEIDALLRVELALRVRKIRRVQVGERRVVRDVLLARERRLRYARTVPTKRSGRNSVALQRRLLLRVLVRNLRFGRVDDVVLVRVLVLLKLRGGILRRVNRPGRCGGETCRARIIRILHRCGCVDVGNAGLLLTVHARDEFVAVALVGRGRHAFGLVRNLLIVRHHLRWRSVCLRTVRLATLFASDDSLLFQNVRKKSPKYLLAAVA